MQLEQTVSNVRAMMRQIKAVLIDLSGTLHIDNTKIPGAVEALEKLRTCGVPLRFVTNTTKESLSVLHGLLTALGFRLERREVFSSLAAARRLVERRQLRPLLLLQPEALEDFDGVNTEKPDSVLVGLAPDKFNYETLTEAFRLVLDGAALIAVHKARYYRRPDGLALGPGPFVAALEYATGRRAEAVGKPEREFFHSALAELGCRPEEAVMIGDDVQQDVGGAQEAGLAGLLVRTGKYRPGDEATISPPPWHVADAFPEAVEHVLRQLELQRSGSAEQAAGEPVPTSEG
ncbi:haloacid dehalogenase-like hydrolase domain-containing protein 2 isoform X1 [Amphibalanus amphitrite]|uniref:haloacid dehalogenase-like hydrolase domain-containing protein 2 isoform X1 n=2 Tax=Amphibalanus amphitrite TaxID=1232801 RepID=UPI001C91DF28|nr:haloacid dehalogenase-like hydrolase domain-containing protein 2 isoform X1 [Amphibalanus amphitrite]